MKRDWNADELAEHWALLPGEKRWLPVRPFLVQKTHIAKDLCNSSSLRPDRIG
jgi:hypothetical protein